MQRHREAVLLNDAQRRHVEVVLAMVERWMTELERLAGHPDGDPALLRVETADMPAGALEAFHSAFTTVRATISRLTAELELQRRVESQRRWARGALMSMIVRLEDTYAGKLRGYGEVNPRLGSVLDPAVDTMKHALAEARVAVNGGIQ